MVNVGKYTVRPMDPMGSILIGSFRSPKKNDPFQVGPASPVLSRIITPLIGVKIKTVKTP